MSPLSVLAAALLGVVFGMAPGDDEQELKFSECPAAVRKTMQAEARGAKIETVTREKESDDETVYWADATISGRLYSIGVLEDGTLAEMNLAVEDDDLPFDQIPAAVRKTFLSEAFNEKIDSVGKDIKYGVTIYETVVEHKGKSYDLVVAEDGTLVEKVLVIDDEEVELAMCPAAVQAALQEQARGGTLHEITRSTGIGRETFEAEVEIKGKVYLIEVAESGYLLSKSLEAGEE